MKTIRPHSTARDVLVILFMAIAALPCHYATAQSPKERSRMHAPWLWWLYEDVGFTEERGATFLRPNATTGPSTWNGGTGNWSDGTMWSPINPPNSDGADVSIDGGNAVASAVTIDGNFTVGRLTLDMGDTLTLQNSRAFTVTDTGGFTGAGSIVNNGSFSLASSGSFTDLIIAGNVSLTGSGTLTLSNASRIRGGGVLTNSSTIQGEANNSGSGLGSNELAIVNAMGGLVDANVSGGTLNVDPRASGTINGLTNQGTLRASNGGILLLNGNGGGAFNNAGGTIQALAGSQVQLANGADITGGTLTTSGDGAIRTVNNASLTDVTNAGNLIVNNSAQGLVLVGTMTNNGTISLASTGSFTDLLINSAVSLTGSGTVTLSNAARIRGSGTLTNSSTIQGEANNSGSGLGNNELAIVNAVGGLVDANVSGATLNVDPRQSGTTNGLTNQGTLRASSGGILQLNGNGGGAFDNTSGTIQALAGSQVRLVNGASITGGMLSTAGNGTIRVGNSASLTNLTNAGSFVAENNSATTLTGTINNTGSMNINSTGSFTDFLLNGAVSLTGGGTISLSSAARIRGSGVLTNVNNIIQGENQNSGTGFGNNEIGIINQAAGLIDANDATGLALVIDPNQTDNLINQGVMRASNGGRLHLTGNGGGTFNNTGGTISALDNSQVRLLSGASITGGTLSTAGSGTIRVAAGNGASLTGLTNAGSFVAENLSSTTLTGTINNTGSININSTGSFTDFLLNGAVSLTGGGTVSLSSAARIRGGGVLTNVNNIIQGENQNSGTGFGNNEVGIINQAAGLIDANDATGLALVIDPSSADNLINQGVMRASNGGRLHLTGNGGGTFNNTGGTISALDNSQVRLLAGASITGGTLSTAGSGTIRVVAGNGASLTDLTNAGSFVAENLSTTTLTGTIHNTGSININSTGSFTDLLINGAVSLTGGGSITLSSADRVRGSGPLTNVDNTIQGENQNSGSIGNNEIAITNQGLIHANVLNLNLGIDPANVGNAFLNDLTGIVRASSGGRIVLTGNGGGSFTNNGIFEVLNGSLFTLDGSAVLTNNVSGVLTLGSYRSIATGNGATLTIRGVNITSLAANTEVILSGAGSIFQVGTTALESTLNTIDGALRILDNRNYTNVNALADNGIIELGGGIFNAPSLTIGANGELFGFGSVTPRPTNSGLIRSHGGTLTFAAGIQGGSGTVQSDASSTLSVSGGASGSSGDFLANNGNLALGANNFTVGLDYTNANFGVGNSFDPRANVSGAGFILALGNVAQTLTGNVTGGATPNALLAFGNVHVGDMNSLNYQINNIGTNGPSLRGALQTSVNGGNITDGRLGGGGVTASNFGPIGLGANSGNLSITFNANSAGALNSQSVHLINNFDNIGNQDLAITGAAFRFANPTAHTPEPVAFGNFHVGDAVSNVFLSVMNNVPNDGFSESLNAMIGGATGGALTNGGSFTGLAPGATNNSSLSVGISTATAGSQNGTATISLESNGNGSSNLGLTNLSSQTVNVTGAVFRYASPSAHTPEPVTFGVVHVGDPLSGTSLSIANNAANDGFSESLNGSIGGGTNGVTASGSFTGLAAGSTNNSSLVVGINTATAGSRNGTATISLESNGKGSSELGLTTLPSQTVNVTGQVNFFADPVLVFQSGSATLIMKSPTAFTLDFGQVAQNSGTYLGDFGVLNFLHDAIFQDALGGSWDTTMVSDFVLNGFSTFSGIGPGDTFDPSIGFDSNMALGMYANTLFLSPTSNNASSATNLGQIQLNVQGEVVVPEPSSVALIFGGVATLLVLQRFRRRIHKAV